MRSFVDPYAALLAKLLDVLPKSPSISLSYEVDQDSFFVTKVASFFGRVPRKIQEQPISDISFHRACVYVEMQDFSIVSHGTDQKEGEALFLAHAEFLERASSYIPLDRARKDGFFISSFKDSETVLIKSLLRFAYRKHAVSETYWGPLDKKKEITTSGVSGHFDKNSATLSAWLELIERDAFLVHWLNTLSPKKIALEEKALIDEDLKTLLRECREQRIECHMLDITSDIEVPVCLAIVRMNTLEGIKVGIGAKAGFDGEHVVKKALVEALGILSSSFCLDPVRLPKDFTPFSDRRIDGKIRMRLSIGEEGLSRSEFLLRSEEEISFHDFMRVREGHTAGTLRQQIAYLRCLFSERYKKDKRYDVFVFSFKNALLRTFGFRVVRVMCDALLPLYLHEHFADPEHPRLKEFVRNKGVEFKAVLNTFPHPFS